MGLVSIETSEGVATIGREHVPQPGMEQGYQESDVEAYLTAVLNSAEIECNKDAITILIGHLVKRVVEMSTRLDHIITIPHGINHAMVVARLMNEVIPRSIDPFQGCLEEKYGSYSEILTVLTALCHDLGYVRIAQSPIVFPAQIFGDDHCQVGAEIFREEIAPLVRAAFPDIPEEYLEKVANAIGDHGRKFSRERQLHAEDRPLLFLLLLADKSDRVGFRRLHALHLNSAFYGFVFQLAENIREAAGPFADRVRELEKIIIPEIIARLRDPIPEDTIGFHRQLEHQLCNLPPERDSYIIKEMAKGDRLEACLLTRMRLLHEIDLIRWQGGGNLEQILVELDASEDIPPELKPLALGYLLHPFAPFGGYGTLADDMEGFMGVKSIEYYFVEGRAELHIYTNSEAGERVAGRIKKGLMGLHIGGEGIVVEILLKQ